MARFEAKIKAKVRWFDEKRGFGFIAAPDFSEDFYVHYSAIVDDHAPVRNGRPFLCLAELQEVVIEEYLKDRAGRLKAIKVRKL